MRRSSLAPEAARAGTPATSDSPHETLFTDSLDAFQSGSESSWAPHRKVQTELMLDDIRAALNETIEVGHFKDEGRALFRSTWSPLSAFAHPRNPRKGLTVPQELKLNGVTEREKRFEAKADNLLHMLDRVHLHLAAVEKTETATDEDDSSDDDR